MGSEIERKFRVDPSWQPPNEGTAFEQGYLNSHAERTVRVRVEGERARLTVKSKTTGITRHEFEYEIPLDNARVMLAICEQPIITKRRHVVMHEGKKWEVDVFAGDNAGLVVAELELASEDEAFAKPPWVREEVSDDPRYYNANLVKHPYTKW